jgi:predicted AlkP superfamily pyrophosphatase or phosphodiesterase
VTLFHGQTIPRSVKERLVKTPTIGPFPTNGPAAPLSGLSELTSTSTNAPTGGGGGRGRRGGGGAEAGGDGADAWTTKALTRGLWRQSVPKYTLLWLSEPDASQHAHGLGSDEAVTALENSDRNFAAVLAALEEKGVLDQTDVFVVSDHGFSSISRGPDLVQSLKRAKFTAGKQFEDPEAGDILVVNLGGSSALYVFNHDEAVIRRLVNYLQTTDFAGVIFSALDMEGTFPLSLAHVAPSKGAPDVVVSFRWNGEENEFGIPGSIAAPDGKRGLGTHGSLSRFDLHNTLIGAGPDIKQGFFDELPSGNIDVAPTVLFLLGVKPSVGMDGRVLGEALLVNAPIPPEPLHKTHEASRDLGWYRWHQHLTTSQVGYAIYYDEGNGESTVR